MSPRLYHQSKFGEIPSTGVRYRSNRKHAWTDARTEARTNGRTTRKHNAPNTPTGMRRHKMSKHGFSVENRATIKILREVSDYGAKRF